MPQQQPLTFHVSLPVYYLFLPGMIEIPDQKNKACNKYQVKNNCVPVNAITQIAELKINTKRRNKEHP